VVTLPLVLSAWALPLPHDLVGDVTLVLGSHGDRGLDLGYMLGDQVELP